jgi:hypothetical protein
MVANVNTAKVCEYADIDAKHATAQADMNIVLAANAGNRDAAQVYLDAVKARFNARVQQVKSERLVQSASAHNADALRRTDLATAMAKAVAAREESNRKLTELQKRQAELQTASMVNWSSKLAIIKSR